MQGQSSASRGHRTIARFAASPPTRPSASGTRRSARRCGGSTYGYHFESSRSWPLAFITRFVGVVAGEPIVATHYEAQRILGTFYLLLFLIITSLIMMNLVIAMLTSGYEEALTQSAQEQAKRMYEDLDREGYCRIGRGELQLAGIFFPAAALERGGRTCGRCVAATDTRVLDCVSGTYNRIAFFFSMLRGKCMTCCHRSAFDDDEE